MPHKFVQEDEISGKKSVFDINIYKWLSGYLKPYWVQFFLNLLVLLIITGINLALPYILKVGIDRYIMPSAREIVGNYNNPKILKTEDGRNFIIMSSISSGKVDELKKKGIFSKKSYYYIPKPKSIPKGLHYLKGKGFILIPAVEMGRLSLKERISLRSYHILKIRQLAFIFIFIIFINLFLTYAQEYHLQKIGQKISMSIRKNIIKKFTRLPVSFFEKNPLGRLVTRGTNDVNALNEFFSSVIVYVFKDIFMIFGILFIMYRMSLLLFYIVLGIFPIIIVITVVFRYKVRLAFRNLRKRLAKINAFLSESLTGIKVIQAFVQEKRTKKKFEGINKDYYDSTIRVLITFAVFRPIIGAIRSIGLAALLYFGGKGILSGIITFGSLVAFISYLNELFQPIRELAERFNVMESAMAASERIHKLLNEKEEISPPVFIKSSINGHIDFQNVWFAYNKDEYILKDVSFHVDKGERLGIVGYTGSGKTTLIKLLTRFYDPDKGEILIDGISTKNFNRAYLRKHIATVYQEPFLFSGTIKNNITLFDDIPEEKLKSAIEVSNLSKVLKKKKQGLLETVGTGGSGLSTGEKQLVTFARALAFDTPILVLDEATANIDPETEYLIQDALFKVMEGRTSIVIAHRLATLKKIDRIIVLHKGKIIEEGTHEDLLKVDGLYAYLFRLQKIA